MSLRSETLLIIIILKKSSTCSNRIKKKVKIKLLTNFYNNLNNYNIRTKSRDTVLDKIMTLYINICILDLFTHKTNKAIMLVALSITHRLSSTFVVHIMTVRNLTAQ